ncbi:16S rRNA (guanine(527)-N(7))-methyltransferase RsmG [Devosia geojensis]|uniref:16S rRNA (guanine(527)-N(7))-methyltransferase RsmG n=1 Tax=Devosia geojensis TaxID=443610 RepID=UPI0006965B17|nr:16S rRNA (guanine(527)-N(7))-methyltransferase RsmG [Devosia geojensis]
MVDARGRAAVLRYAPHFSRDPEAVIADLESYALLLEKWQRIQNLVSRETLADMWRRHFADSLQVLKLLTESDRTILDLGSGGGFPALPLAIASKGRDRRFILVEPTSRKASFLRTVARNLGLDVRVEARRTEDIDSRETGRVDVITSRALASLPQLCALAAPFFGPETRAIFHKGREHVEELVESGALWQHDVVLVKSDTDDSGVLVELKNLRSKQVRS